MKSLTFIALLSHTVLAMNYGDEGEGEEFIHAPDFQGPGRGRRITSQAAEGQREGARNQRRTTNPWAEGQAGRPRRDARPQAQPGAALRVRVQPAAPQQRRGRRDQSAMALPAGAPAPAGRFNANTRRTEAELKTLSKEQLEAYFNRFGFYGVREEHKAGVLATNPAMFLRTKADLDTLDGDALFSYASAHWCVPHDQAKRLKKFCSRNHPDAKRDAMNLILKEGKFRSE